MGAKADAIRAGLLGRDVREAIAQGVEVAENLRTDYDDQVINAGNENAEIVDARAGKAKLRDRLDDFDERKRDKSIKIGLEDLSSTALGAISGNATFNLLSIPQDLSVTLEKTDFLKLIGNLVDVTKIETNTRIQSAGISSYTGFSTTGYIPININDKYISNTTVRNIGFYDSNKNFISQYDSNKNGIIDIVFPTNAKYIRFSVATVQSEYINSVALMKGSKITDFSNYQQYGYDFTLKKDVDFMSDTYNLFDKTKVMNYFYIATGGMGLTSALTNYVYFTDIQAKKYVFNGTVAGLYLYDSNGIYINRILSATSYDNTNGTVAYLGFSIQYSDKAVNDFMICVDTLPSEYIGNKIIDSIYLPKAQNVDLTPFYSKWKGKKWCSYGDSITAGNTWQPSISSTLGFGVHKLRGIGGTTVSGLGSTWWAYSDGSYAGRPEVDSVQPVGSTEVSESSLSSQIRINTMISTDIDLLVVMGGANDWAQNYGLGTIADTNIYTFYGSYQTMLDRLGARIPNATIVLMNTPYRQDEDVIPNSNGNIIEDYRKAIREIANKYGYPLIELRRNSGINENNVATYLSDVVHPNSAGGKKIASIIIGQLKALEPVT